MEPGQESGELCPAGGEGAGGRAREPHMRSASELLEDAELWRRCQANQAAAQSRGHERA